MEHLHNIIDKDNHFIIDPITRKIKPETHEKNKLVEGDHKSERYTFEIPKFIEGHDMSECNVTQIHYLNVSADKNKKVEDIYEVDDLGVLENKPDTLAFTWLIKEQATRYSGLLSFAIVFKCTTGDIIDYAWHTEIYSNISISKSMNNAPGLIEEYSDILEKWKEDLFSVDGRIQTALSESLQEIDNKSTDIVNALDEKSEEIIRLIEDHGVVQVSEEEPSNPNVDLYINPNEKTIVSVPEINDETISLEDTWSSQKISEEIKNVDSNSSIETDITLTESGKAADAKIVGTKLKEVDDKISSLENDIDGKLDKNQGAENKGKALVVGEDGILVPETIHAGGKWRVIKEFNIPQDINAETTDIKYLISDDGRIVQFNVNSDSENKPISLKKVFLYINKKTPFYEYASPSNVLFRYNTFTGNYNLLQFYRITNEQTRIIIGEIEKISKYIKCTASAFKTTTDYSWSSNTEKNVYVYNNILEDENITEITVGIGEDEKIKPDLRGSTVTILGVDT